jgi:ectoine hydroxylase-related dioxygenase (phytanoyl-CoA dioxygenase family)
MEIGNWRATEDLNEIYRDIRRLGLESNLAELEAFGFTVIENILDGETTRKLRDEVLRAAEGFLNQKLDLDREETHREVKSIPYLLYRDQVFEKALLCEKTLVLITYLLGNHCLLSSMSSFMKGPGGKGLLLHSDTGAVPAPLSAYGHVANVNFALTDYTEAGGALAMVPGSHRMHRQPTAHESGLDGDERNPDAIPIEVPAGSAIVFHGNTWHGSFPRQIPGLRINLAVYFCRHYMQGQENYKDHIPEDFLKRYGEDSRMATLLGRRTHYGWAYDGPDKKSQQRNRVVGRTWQS